MKLLLRLIIFAFLWLLVLGAKRRARNDNCLVKHKMIACRGPYRSYYTFSLMLLDCYQVYTRCRKVNRRNEYHTEQSCRDDCHFFRQPLKLKPGKNSWSIKEVPVNPVGPEVTKRTTTESTAAPKEELDPLTTAED
ncbi:uncharacterized protein [Drosophila takahashii]|uniref:uncharacterized protein isoform X1 n=2 Tax=Drosophila takahashii TaxID=29030 RepID=UPI003898E8D5